MAENKNLNIANITYREKTLTIDAGQTMELTFSDSDPNYIHFNNYSGAVLYFGKSVFPTANSYDLVIDSFGDNLFGSPNGFKKAYLFNSGAAAASFKMTSFEAPFDPSTLRTTGTATTTANGVAARVDATIIAHNVPLPAGNNNIGRVVVSEMPAATFTMDVLPAGDNNIGNVDIVTMAPLVEGVSHIGSVNVDNAITIGSMPPVTVTNEPVRRSNQYFEGDIANYSTADFNMGTADVIWINYIKNDGTVDVYVGFDDIDPSVAGNRGNGLNMCLRLRGGESVTDFRRQCSRVRFFCIDAAGTHVRFLGV
jgi:hypothetical protein